MCSQVKRIALLLFALTSILVVAGQLRAVSLSPDLLNRLRNEGRLQEWGEKMRLAREKGVWQANRNPPLDRRGPLTVQADIDTVRALVIAVDFDDNVRSRSTEEFDTLLFSNGFVLPFGSMRDFYWENSYGAFEVIGDVVGWYRMPEDYVYYTCTFGEHGFGPYPYNAQKLVEDAVNAADPYIDFTDYDRDGNGFVDALFVVHAGPGTEETGNPCHIWSHRWVTNGYIYLDGVKVYDYSMEPETRIGGALVDIGVFCHEFGHVLGLPDLYDTDYSSSGLGRWSLMAGGSWNNGGKSPAHFDAWSKYRLGFSSVSQLSSNQTDVEILQAETSPLSYRVWNSGAGGSQYFLVENRQRIGFDSHLPGEGLLIYHVDESKSGNSQEWCPGAGPYQHYKVALEQADGSFGLEACYGSGDNGNGSDPFPGYQDRRSFDDSTAPASRDYYDNPTQVAVWNISDSDSAMYANLDVTWSRPALSLEEFIFDDLLGGDGDGKPEGGETVRLYFTLSNIWLPLSGAEVTASADAPGIDFSDDYAYLGEIGTGGSADNYGDPVEFMVDAPFPGEQVTFTLHVEGNGGSYAHDFDVEVAVGSAQILVVDDDSGSAEDYLSYYTTALDSLNHIYDIWDTQNKSGPSFSFGDYQYLIWFTGDQRADRFNRAQVESLMSFLDNGGGLFLTSQDAVEILSGSSDPWDIQLLNDYLHVGYNGNSTKHLVAGYPGDEVGDDLWIYPGSTPGAANQTSKDNLIPDSQSDTVLVYANTGFAPTDLVAGTKFENEVFKVVVFGFGFEAINSSGNYFHGHTLSKPEIVMQGVLDWLKPPSTYASGDANGDGSVDGGDAVYLISYLYRGGPAPDPFVSGDANGDCTVTAGDIVYLIGYLYRGGSPPQPGCA
jgi:M6 family metalloprotease-like protein